MSQEESDEPQRPRRQAKKGGKPNRFEPTDTKELIASPSVLSCFQELRCFDFRNKVQEIKIHPQLAELFSLRLHRHKVHLAGLNFELTPKAISKATKIPCIGEKWFRQTYLDLIHYQPFLKPSCQVACKTIFHFSHLLDRYALLMKIVMKYFTCEGRFSRIYSYHIRLLMHFTRTKLLNLPYFLCKSIEKMSTIMKKKLPAQQRASLFHHSLVKIIVTH